jgi:hypothetical protein
LVALAGEIVAVKVSVPPIIIVVDVLFRETPDTATEPPLLETVTVQIAVLLPSEVVTVMVELPTEIAVTVPVDDTVATAGTLLLHVTFWLVALEGEMLANNVSVPPTVRLVDDLFKVTLVTGITAAVTVTEQAAVFLPSSVVTVMAALPVDTPITMPFVTVATELLLVFHVTFWLVAL